ncbi:protein deacetylase HDAC6-like isoform X2 [Tubulanus polymorphus]|uniref:protein deacetylase HDAC6-like isoform X2 n=1 Tax=Tubulanus polymorphus TaxID=672921 RepID=UPI003DA660D9
MDDKEKLLSSAEGNDISDKAEDNLGWRAPSAQNQSAETVALCDFQVVDENTDPGVVRRAKTPSGTSTRPKTSSSKKKSKSASASLAESKKRGRQLRSSKNQGGRTLFLSTAMDKRKDFPSETGLVYDEQMAAYHCLWDKNHPERPERITESYKRCVEYGLVKRCTRLEVKTADLCSILLGHDEEIYELVKKSSELNENDLKHESSLFDSVYFHNHSFQAASLVLGGIINIVEQIVDSKVKNGLTITRPPGHHAMYNECNGYCYFNNVAIAAKHGLENLGLQRILIVDWDVHHGQGIQYMFYDDPRVLYFSIHRYELGYFWPNLKESDYDHIGTGRGIGYNINIPWNKTGMSNSEYLAVFHQILMPIAYEFQPELVLVCSGFDAAIGCPEGEMLVEPVCYAHLTHQLMSLANGKLCIVMEGGYCIKSLSECVALTLRTLLGDPCPPLKSLNPPCESALKTIYNALNVLRPYWKSLKMQGICDNDRFSEITSSNNADLYYERMNEKFDEYEIYDSYPSLDSEKVAHFDQVIDNVIRQTDLTKAPNQTCFVYDERMRRHKDPVNPGHPERPDRISRIFTMHEDFNLVNRCQRLPSRSATEDELLLVHSPSHVKRMKDTKTSKNSDLKEMQLQYNSIFFNQDSYECALLAAGCLLQVIDNVLTGKSQNGIAVVRPPGHHAEDESACGFCLFNNVAIAAKYSQKKYNLSRILIVDWDVHHGNGIQHMFERDPGVLYISLHRYDNGTFFPASEDANFDMVGVDEGEGFNVNIPWNKRGLGDFAYISAFHHVVMPIAYEYNPELVIVSAGFDAAQGDPLGGFKVTPEGYAHMTHMLMGLANGKVILALEGGYNLQSISESMAMCTSTLLGDACPILNHPVIPCDSAVKTLQQVLDTQQKYWKCLKYRVDLPAPVKRKKMVRISSDQDSAVSSSTDAWESSVASADQSTDEFIHAMDRLTLDNRQADNQIGNSDMGAAGEVISFDIDDGGIRVDNDDELEGAIGGKSSPVMSPSTTINGLIGQMCVEHDVNELHAVVPLLWCPHLYEVQPVPGAGIDVRQSCMDCGDPAENWICLVCYDVHCGRYINEHMLMHGLSTDHRVVLSFSDLSVWCYGCDSYVHNELVIPAKRAAHISKFGEDIPL